MKKQFSKLTSIDVSVTFNEKEYKLTLLKTRSGALLWQATHISMILTGVAIIANDHRAAYYHFRKVSIRCPELIPHKRRLASSLKVVAAVCCRC